MFYRSKSNPEESPPGSPDSINLSSRSLSMFISSNGRDTPSPPPGYHPSPGYPSHSHTISYHTIKVIFLLYSLFFVQFRLDTNFSVIKQNGLEKHLTKFKGSLGKPKQAWIRQMNSGLNPINNSFMLMFDFPF